MKCSGGLCRLPADPLPDPDSGLCTTIEGHERSFWLQLYEGQINFLHLDDESKERVLDAVLQDVGEPAGIEKGSYVTFNLPRLVANR